MKILGLSPHVDDLELGAGGSISRWAREGHEIKIVAFTLGSGEATEQEFRGSMTALGVKDAWLMMYSSRAIPERRQEILEEFFRLRDDFDPDVVLAPMQVDTHQDHQAITAEAIRAFKRSSIILGYELPWNNVGGIRPKYFVRLERSDVEIKGEALSYYESQLRRDYFDEELIWSLAILRGAQCGADYAEAFELIRFIEKIKGERE